jgi:hypothetical protein
MYYEEVNVVMLIHDFLKNITFSLHLLRFNLSVGIAALVLVDSILCHTLGEVCQEDPLH